MLNLSEPCAVYVVCPLLFVVFVGYTGLSPLSCCNLKSISIPDTGTLNSSCASTINVYGIILSSALLFIATFSLLEPTVLTISDVLFPSSSFSSNMAFNCSEEYVFQSNLPFLLNT